MHFVHCKSLCLEAETLTNNLSRSSICLQPQINAHFFRRQSLQNTDQSYISSHHLSCNITPIPAPYPPVPTGLLAVRTLDDASLLVLSGQGNTVVARRLSPQQTTLHEQTLGALTATALHIFSRRGQTMFAVGDGGWSSLVNSPQGVKVG